MSADGKVVVVTGGSGGIGEAVALHLSRDGYRVAVVAVSSVGTAEKVAALIRAEGGDANGFACDLRDAQACKNLIDNVLETFGKIDALVNAAGVCKPTPAGSAELHDTDKMIDINLRGTWNMINSVVPILKATGAGKIVNIAAIAGVTCFGTYAIYCATKAAIVMMTRALACELARENINVNCVAPGDMASDTNEEVRNEPGMQGLRDFMAVCTPRNSTFSEPKDVAVAISFLASDSARAMHGSCLLMDEGMSAGL